MAVKIFNEMKTARCEPNICSYTALINAFAREGHCDKAEEIFEQLQEAGHEPDVYTYNALMEAYRYVLLYDLKVLSCFSPFYLMFISSDLFFHYLTYKV